MASIDNVLTALRTNYSGEPWHGNPFRKLIDGVDEKLAHAHPIASAKSIAELLAHAIAWIEIVERRLAGEQVKITPELDFPDVANVRWSDLVDHADRAHASLLEAVGRLSDADLARNVAGKPYSVQFMLSGLMHHNTYHGAQIAILKKAG